jgi:hypothetical protein
VVRVTAGRAFSLNRKGIALKSDWWKWAASFFAGVALTSVATGAGWFIAFEKDAVTRTEMSGAISESKKTYESAVADLKREYGSMGEQMDRIQRDLSEFKIDSTADRKALSTKMDMVLQILTTRKALESNAP